MSKPVIELKNIKYAAFASEETHCYDATLYVDGEKWGTVSNQGHGGPDMFHGAGKSYDDLKALDVRIAETYPKIDMTSVGCPGETMDESLETICSDIVSNFLVEKDAKKVVKGKVAFFKTAPAPGEHAPLYTIKVTPSHSVERLIDHVRTKHPEAVILNALEGPALVEAYRQAA